jgi:hypothetical protein
MTKSIESERLPLVAVASQQGINAPEEQTLPKRKAPHESQPPNTQHGDEFAV